MDRRIETWTYQMRTIYSMDRQDCGQTHLLNEDKPHMRASEQTGQQKKIGSHKKSTICRSPIAGGEGD